MNLNEFTPCRKVGLSRKKNTPLKTVESLLIENVEKVSNTPRSADKTVDVKPIIKNDLNPDTPCRQVGLSRKRKNSTPLGDFSRKKNVRSSNSKNTKKQTSKHEEKLDCFPEKISEKTMVLKGESKEDNHAGCAKKLSNLFNSPTSIKHDKCYNSQNSEHTTKNKKEKEPEVECDNISLMLGNKEINENVNKCAIDSVENGISECKFPNGKNKQEKEPEVECDNISLMLGNKEETNENVNKCSIDSVENGISECKFPNGSEIVKYNETKDCDENDSSSVIIEKKSSQTSCNDENLKQFIKVCYSNEKENKKEQVFENKRPKLEKNSKFSCVVIEDDDDFEIGPKKKKSKKLLERSKTEVDKKEKKSRKNEFKKSLSVGDSRSKALKDSLKSSNTSSLNSLNNCFVKLEKIKEPTDNRNSCLTPQDQSDDDFEAFSCTPKENKIKKLDSLEKEVEEKRQILEDLKRAKLHKRMHSTTDLKELTSRWKNGCIDALQDLLKQLNMHSQMDMQTLLRKLSIPEDFIPLSQ